MTGTSDWLDYYELLGLYDPREDIGIGPDVSPARLKEAWTFERKKWHPDNFSQGSRDWELATERFKSIDKACQPEKRWRSDLGNPIQRLVLSR